MKKIFALATMAFLVSGVSFAYTGDKGKSKAKKTSSKTCGKECGKKKCAD